VDVQVWLVGDESGSELRSLAQWLRDDEDMHGVRFKLKNAAMKPGDMGPTPELIQAVFQPQGVLVALAGVLGTWIGARRRATKIHVRVDSKEAEIDGAKIDNPEQIAAQLLRDLKQ
jgi:hypothetical protein